VALIVILSMVVSMATLGSDPYQRLRSACGYRISIRVCRWSSRMSIRHEWNGERSGIFRSAGWFGHGRSKGDFMAEWQSIVGHKVAGRVV
jgi:hypothetical protein